LAQETSNAALAGLRLSWAHFTKRGKFWLGPTGGGKQLCPFLYFCTPLEVDHDSAKKSWFITRFKDFGWKSKDWMLASAEVDKGFLSSFGRQRCSTLLTKQQSDYLHDNTMS
jgi:hypothetical protein